MNQSPDDAREASDEAPIESQAIASRSDCPEDLCALSETDRLQRVIRRFHSEVGSPLAAVAMRIELLRNEMRLDPATDALMEELSHELGEVIDSVRRSLKELRDLEATSPPKR